MQSLIVTLAIINAALVSGFRSNRMGNLIMIPFISKHVIFLIIAYIVNVHQTVLEAKKSVGDLTEEDLRGKRVFVRADFNVPLEKGKITDDTRIRGAIPTIKYLTSKGAKVLLSSHLGRPKGGYEAKFSLGTIYTILI